jgi:hypothetical protein
VKANNYIVLIEFHNAACTRRLGGERHHGNGAVLWAAGVVELQEIIKITLNKIICVYQKNSRFPQSISIRTECSGGTLQLGFVEALNPGTKDGTVQEALDCI